MKDGTKKAEVPPLTWQIPHGHTYGGGEGGGGGGAAYILLWLLIMKRGTYDNCVFIYPYAGISTTITLLYMGLVYYCINIM